MIVWSLLDVKSVVLTGQNPLSNLWQKGICHGKKIQGRNLWSMSITSIVPSMFWMSWMHVCWIPGRSETKIWVCYGLKLGDLEMTDADRSEKITRRRQKTSSAITYIKIYYTYILCLFVYVLLYLSCFIHIYIHVCIHTYYVYLFIYFFI